MIWAQKKVDVHILCDGTPDANQQAALDEALRTGWEPYAVTPASTMTLTHWLKRSQD